MPSVPFDKHHESMVTEAIFVEGVFAMRVSRKQDILLGCVFDLIIGFASEVDHEQWPRVF